MTDAQTLENLIGRTIRPGIGERFVDAPTQQCTDRYMLTVNKVAKHDGD